MEERHYQSGLDGCDNDQRQRLKKLFRVVQGGKVGQGRPDFDVSALRNDEFLKHHYLEKKPTPPSWLETE